MSDQNRMIGAAYHFYPRNIVRRLALLIVVLVSALSVAAAQQPADVRPLVTGVPVEHDLAGGQTHQYQVTAEAGQWVKILVAQKGVNVVVRVYSPDGKPLWEVDVDDRTEGTEEVTLVAEQAGNYRVEVTPTDQGAKAGRYEATLTELRAATAPERSRWGAEKTVNEALALMDQGKKESFEAAITKFDSALALNRAAGYQPGEIIVLLYLATAHQNLSQYQKSLEVLNQALPLTRAAGDRRMEATVLNNIGTMYGFLGQQQKRLEYLRQALPIIRATGDKVTEAATLSNLGQGAHTLGDYQQALDYFAEALPLLQAEGNKPFLAIVLNNIGAAHRNLGETAKALEYYQQALPLLRAEGDKQNEAVTLDNIGVLYNTLGNSPEALKFFNQALPLRRATGNKRGEAVTLDNLGVTARLLGDAPKAAEYHRQALDLFQAIGERYKAGVALDNLGVAERELGNLEQAFAHHEQAVQVLRAAGDRLAEARALRNLAQVEREQGRLAEAVGHIEQAITRLEFVRAGVRNQETRSSFFATVADFYEFDTDLLMQRHKAEPNAGHDRAALRVSEQSRARSLLEQLGEARTDIRAGVASELLERERSLKDRLTARLDALTRLLGGKYTEAQKAAAEKEIAALTDQYRQAQAEIRKTSPRYAALTQPQPLELSEIQQQLDRDTMLLEYALGEKRSYLWVVTPTAISSYELPSRAVIEAAARTVYDSLMTRPAKPLSPDTQMTERSAALGRMLLGPAAAQLGNKRLVIVAPGLLSYLPFAALPVPQTDGRGEAAAAPLIAGHEVVNLPSASVLSVLRGETSGRQAAPGTVAVLADPVFEAGDPRIALAGKNKSSGKQAQAAPGVQGSLVAVNSPLAQAVRSMNPTSDRGGLTRLPFSLEEANAILSLVPPAAALKATGFQANRMTATSNELSRYRLIHFATHGLLNSEHPELSGLVLSLVDENGRPQDGFLRLHEIYNLRLPADVVVLSACQTGLGKEVKGEGLVGLARGFMYAGAPRVVASLWQVDDLATAELMKQFYRGMLKDGLRPAAALRAAQIELSKQRRWAAPYFWAAFTLQGEWK